MADVFCTSVLLLVLFALWLEWLGEARRRCEKKDRHREYGED
jgi:hypothetical protein